MIVPVLSVKKLTQEAKDLVQAYDEPAGLDVFSTHIIKIENGAVYLGTGLAIAVPDTHYIELHNRSSTHKQNAVLVNSVGIIDSDYRNEIIIALQPTVYFSHKYKDLSATDMLKEFAMQLDLSKPLAQLVLRRKERYCIDYTDELPQSKRGMKGFGSSDK